MIQGSGGGGSLGVRGPRSASRETWASLSKGFALDGYRTPKKIRFRV